MRCVLDEGCRENRNTDFMFCNFFPKIVPFMTYCRKMLWSQRGHRWQNMAHTRCMLDKQGQTHPRTRTHTDKFVICNTCYFSTATMIRERASSLRYTYIVCLAIASTRVSNKLLLKLGISFSDHDRESLIAACSAFLQLHGLLFLKSWI